MKTNTLFISMLLVALVSGTNAFGGVIMPGSAITKESSSKIIPVLPDTIIFISNDVDYDSTAIKKLRAEGYVVITTYPILKNNQTMIDSLNKASLVIVGRSTVSSDITPARSEWNELTVPLMLMSQHSSASNKLNWFNTTTMTHVMATDTIMAFTSFPDDTIFSGVGFISGDTLEWAYSPEDLVILTNSTNGIIMVSTNYLANAVIVARFEPGISFYDSICDKPYAPRTYFGAGLNTSGVLNPYTFTSESEKVWLAEVKRLINEPYSPYLGNSDAGLTGITLNTGVLVPEFHKDTLTYNVTLPSGTTSVTVGATTSYACASTAGTGAVNVSSGSGVANIAVTAEDKVTTSATYTVSFSVEPTNINEMNPVMMKIHPNPASTFVEIELNKSFLGTELIISNVLGSVVLRKTITETNEQVDLHGLSKGIYIIHVENGEKRVMQRIVIQ